MIAMRYGDLLGCDPERAPQLCHGEPVEPRPSVDEARELVADPDHDAVLSWTETIEWSRTATELILRS